MEKYMVSIHIQKYTNKNDTEPIEKAFTIVTAKDETDAYKKGIKDLKNLVK